MAEKKLKQKIRDMLKKTSFSDPSDRVTVSDGVNGNIHLKVVSHKFDGLGLKDENDLIWSVLVKNLQPDEWGKVTLSIGASPDEVESNETKGTSFF